MVSVLFSTQTFLYVSGRAPSLYALGKGIQFPARKSKSPASPSAVYWLRFSALSFNNVCDIYKTRKNLFNLPTAIAEIVLKQIVIQTGGIPRFILFTFEYLDTLSVVSETSLSSAAYLEFMQRKLSLERSLRGVERSAKLWKGYTKLLLLSAMKVPLRTDDLDPKWFGMDDYFSSRQTISILDVCNLLDLYTTRSTTNAEESVIQYPGIMLDYISTHNKSHSMPLFAYLNRVSGIFWTPGTSLQVFTRVCLLFRMHQ